MSEIPKQYQKDSYINWHQETLKELDLERKITEFRESIKANSVDKLAVLGQLLLQIKQRTEGECKVQFGGFLAGEFDVPTDAFIPETYPKLYDLLFKSTASIIEKCWRKNCNRTDNFVCLQTLSTEITDLIRTSVVCPTLQHARMFTERLGAWRELLPEEDLTAQFSSIDNIQVDQEAKLASGYFAYHTLVRFVDGTVVEVQFYSLLSSAWRNMSHKLYEKTRVDSSASLGLGTPEARLISLGHMLYLAEYELSRLTEEFSPPRR